MARSSRICVRSTSSRSAGAWSGSAPWTEQHPLLLGRQFVQDQRQSVRLDVLGLKHDPQWLRAQIRAVFLEWFLRLIQQHERAILGPSLEAG